MPPLFLYNTLSRRKEEFKAIKAGQVGLYTCGPTVYNYAHIGNLRTYLFEDFLYRILLYNNYQVKHVTNITDVGHLTGDMNMGEDKMEKMATKVGQSAWQIAAFYTSAFKKDLLSLNIKEPQIWCKASDNIAEQIALVKTLEDKGYTYRTSDGIYFNTAKFKDYNKLSHLPLKKLKEGARVEINPEKKNLTDFALWKFSPTNVKRQMEWESPWGIGFPGWHIECSAMSYKFLNPKLDIHCGGVDHINVHHTNEIAQSEAATGKKFFNYWLHGAFLNIKGGKKMAKSKDNFLTLKRAFIEKNLSPLAYRFAAIQVHYRKPMEYSEEGMKQAQLGLNSLYNQVAKISASLTSNKKGKVNQEFKDKFILAINDDLNLPQALALVFNLIKSKLNNEDKLATILDFDKIFALDLDKATSISGSNIDLADLSPELQHLIRERQQARSEKDWPRADKLRDEIEAAGYLIEDMADSYKISKK